MDLLQRNAASPISNIPVELLLEIFHIICKPPLPKDYNLEEDKIHISRPLVGYNSPLILGKICREWRIIAWSAPSLWTFIYIVWSTSERRSQVLQELLEEWLRRTNQLAISIVLRKLAGSGWTEQPAYRSLFNLLVSECLRWELIDIFVPSHCSNILDKSRNRIPLLRTASVIHWKPIPVATFLTDVPRLCDLTIRQCLLPESTQYLLLTQLNISRVNLTDLFQILRQTPNLKSCHLDGMNSGSSHLAPGTSMPHIHLKHLQLLVIRYLSSQILSFISAPILRDLSISETHKSFHPSTIANFLERCACPLQRLGVEAQEINAPQLYFLFTRSDISALTGLKIMTRYGHIVFEEAIAEILKPYPSSFNDADCPSSWVSEINFDRETNHKTPILPNLQNFELCMGGETPLHVLDMLKDRWKYGHPLEVSKVPVQTTNTGFSKISSVRFPRKWHTEALLQLQQEIKDGLKIEFYL